MTEDRPARPNIPLGNEMLSLHRRLEDECEANFDDWIPNAGRRAPRTLEALGTALSYLDRIASCWWACRGGDHLRERLVGRAANNATATLRLMKIGYYDEALGIVRQIGEVANLILLFVQSEESFEGWRDASEKERRDKFRPGQIRDKLRKLALPMPMNDGLYSRLSGLSTHVNPSTTPQSHNPFEIPLLGARFQEAGALVTLNHLAEQVALVLGFGAVLIQPPVDQRVVNNASIELIESIGSADLGSIEEYWSKVRGSSRFRETEAVLKQLQNISRNKFANNLSQLEIEDSSPDGTT